MIAPHMPMMNDEGLLDCPFCGSDDCYPDYAAGSNSHSICCGNCSCTTGPRLSKVLAVYRWNTRNGHLYTRADFAEKSWEMQNSDLTGGV